MTPMREPSTLIAPVRRSKREARDVYDRRSRGYERFEGRLEQVARETGEARLAVRPAETVLDIGSGPGASLVTFGRAVGSDGRVIGLDLAPGMHAVASTRTRAASLADRVQLVVADAACVPVRTASCDAVFSSFTLELFDTPELPVVLGEIRRVLRAEGRLSIVALNLLDPRPLMMRLYLLVHSLLPRLADCRPIPVTELVTAAGFLDVHELRQSLFGIPVAIVTARNPNE